MRASAYFSILISLFIFSSASTSIRAEISPALKAGVSETDYPPYSFTHKETQKMQGISIEVCNHLAASLGLKIEYIKRPFARSLVDLSSGKLDLMCTLFNTNSRSPDVLYTSVPHAMEDVILFTLKDSKTNLRKPGVTAIKDYDVGGIQGYYYGPDIGESSGHKIHYAQNEEQLLKLLLKKRVAYILGNKEAILSQAKEMKIQDRIKFLDFPIYSGPVYIGISRKRPKAFEKLSLFTRELIKFQSTEKYKRLLRKYNLTQPDY
ncbi:MAG: hypothetical protein CME63_03550 [Halobacteriovoraceae bacterium]|nr:hypothetical protein [Halobacteriovoraceae bacterium]|tara:strand:+ start:92487 stop:93275 length:789 start_codon:yes stop_codon:yes gene_type:complete